MNSSQIDKVINLAVKDTKKGARVVAKVFYRSLRKQGFSDNQIIDITTNILSCLMEQFDGYHRRTDNSIKHEEETHKEFPLQQEKVTRTYTKFRSRYNDNESIQYGI